MYVDQSGTGSIWMATYQTAGAQSGDLPVLTLPANTFSEGALRRLPPAFNHASGFFADDNAGEMWISRCEGTCGASGGTPYVVVTALAGRNKPVLHKIQLPLPCDGLTASGGLTVGDIGYQLGKTGASFYVIGQNSPGSSGALWSVAAGSYAASCYTNVPAKFDPSPYFARVGDRLLFGVAGQESQTHGFYDLANGTIAVEPKPRGTATHLSAIGELLYYVANGADSTSNGLGAYRPPKGAWNVFPTVAFASSPYANGVAAADQGAWFTALGTCNGQQVVVCLGRAVYLKSFAAIPQLQLGDTVKGQTTQFGTFANPQTSPSPGPEEQPFNVHSGPFKAASQNPRVCRVEYVTTLTYRVRGLQEGPCPLTITNTNTKQVQPLVTNVH